MIRMTATRGIAATTAASAITAIGAADESSATTDDAADRFTGVRMADEGLVAHALTQFESHGFGLGIGGNGFVDVGWHGEAL